MRTILQDVDRVLASPAYKMWATSHKIDSGKVKAERQGNRRPQSSDSYGRTLVVAIRAGLVEQQPKPQPPPPPPPPAFKRVAPITVREEGGSDQRVCLWASPGVMYPGVSRLASGQYTDESGAIYRSDGDGLEDSAVRPKVQDPALVGARSLDGRSACDCPPVGEPTKNTGSWAI